MGVKSGVADRNDVLFLHGPCIGNLPWPCSVLRVLRVLELNDVRRTEPLWMVLPIEHESFIDELGHQ